MGFAAPLFALLAAQSVVAAPAPPAARPVPEGSTPSIVRFRAGEALCGGAVQRPVHAEEPVPRLLWSGPGESAPAWTAAVRFRIERYGRPHRVEAVSRGPTGIDERDLPAAFAAWRFAPGDEREGCEIRFRAEPVALESAGLDSLHRYLVLTRVLPDTSAERNRAFRRIQPSGQVCADGSFTAKWSVAYPDWRGMGRPGTFGFTYLRGDVDEAGVPERVRIIASSGEAELERRSIDAVRRSRYPGGARHDCLFFYVVWDSPFAAPPAPSLSEFRRPDALCPEAPVWTEAPRPAHPAAFKARRIEGWAIVRYDLSPEGRVLDAAVLAAEPAAPFGEAARLGLAGALGAQSPSGYRDCVERIDFRLPVAKPCESIRNKQDPCRS